MNWEIQALSATALGIALAACCGFRVFVPLLVAGLASRLHLFHFADHFAWLSSTPALITLGAATAVEIAGYYIPFIDNILDTIAAPMATIAGTVLATAVIPIDSEWIKWLVGIIAGGGSAGLIASGTGLLRLFSTKATLGTGNIFVATGENAAAIAGSVLSFLMPVVMAVLCLLFMIWIFRKMRKKIKNRRAVRSA
ncbi:hypothetical protein A8C56_14640 [Niabella ginsenosidivorans]|uniref:DUF4126 domain-containing protein n=1 Tax=Niabella ginsenosidivorans TaxID=1176587 RepID=A0A1A9I5T1_9BACT|nr:DUF4126 domain-containing protein [Niabella ginsenosidivorans]ANH82042.1 hypothetical protein A8C56_14640 [Niabella ginsenosidivorans]